MEILYQNLIGYPAEFYVKMVIMWIIGGIAELFADGLLPKMLTTPHPDVRMYMA